MCGLQVFDHLVEKYPGKWKPRSSVRLNFLIASLPHFGILPGLTKQDEYMYVNIASTDSLLD